MTAWTQDQETRFLNALVSMWPGGWFEKDGRTEKSLVWLRNAAAYHSSVAIEGLRELYEGNETARLPSLATAHEVWRRIQSYVDGRARRATEALAGPDMEWPDFLAECEFDGYDWPGTPETKALRRKFVELSRPGWLAGKGPFHALKAMRFDATDDPAKPPLEKPKGEALRVPGSALLSDEDRARWHQKDREFLQALASKPGLSKEDKKFLAHHRAQALFEREYLSDAGREWLDTMAGTDDFGTP